MGLRLSLSFTWGFHNSMAQCMVLLQAGSHAKFKCYICAQMVPDMKTMQVNSAMLHSSTNDLETINLLHERLGLT